MRSKHEVIIANNVPFETMGLIRNAVYNTFHIEVNQRLGEYQDTNYRYDCYVTPEHQPPSKITMEAIRDFTRGIIYACNARC